MSIFDADNIEKSLNFLSKEDREKVLDAVYCEIHNSWGTLKGNTAESDIEWFARWLCDGFSPRGYQWLDDTEKRFWNSLAEQSLRGLPMLMSRMEMRYEAYKDALHVLLRAQWEAEKANEKGDK